MIMTLRYDTIR